MSSLFPPPAHTRLTRTSCQYRTWSSHLQTHKVHLFIFLLFFVLSSLFSFVFPYFCSLLLFFFFAEVCTLSVCTLNSFCFLFLLPICLVFAPFFFVHNAYVVALPFLLFPFMFHVLGLNNSPPLPLCLFSMTLFYPHYLRCFSFWNAVEYTYTITYTMKEVCTIGGI